MTTFFPKSQTAEPFYPSSDGEPLAETSVHLDAIINTVVALRLYLPDQSAIVLADNFLYYAKGFPKLRVAPDVMVIFNVPPGPRDNFKTWEEQQSPSVIFEITSPGTRDQDEGRKKDLYEQLEIAEYWQFDPKGEWIPEQLRGYRLQDENYHRITDNRSIPLQLRLEVDKALIAFYREDTGERLPTADSMINALQQERQRAETERQRAETERQRAEEAEQQIAALKEQLRSMGINPEQTDR